MPYLDNHSWHHTCPSRYFVKRSVAYLLVRYIYSQGNNKIVYILFIRLIQLYYHCWYFRMNNVERNHVVLELVAPFDNHTNSDDTLRNIINNTSPSEPNVNSSLFEHSNEPFGVIHPNHSFFVYIWATTILGCILLTTGRWEKVKHFSRLYKVWNCTGKCQTVYINLIFIKIEVACDSGFLLRCSDSEVRNGLPEWPAMSGLCRRFRKFLDFHKILYRSTISVGAYCEIFQ